MLARLLQQAGIDSQIGQMWVDGVWGGHIVTLAHVEEAGGMTPVDALFDLHLEEGDGTLANIENIVGNWDAYSTQPGPNYPQRYGYERLRRTNWERIPIVFPLAHSAAEMLFGEDTVAKFSLRSWFLNQYRSLARGLEALAMIPLLVLLYEWRSASLAETES